MGAALGLLVAVASNAFTEVENPKLEAVLAALPGANCGACGFAGCAAYAAAVVDGAAPPGVCPVGGASCASRLARIMGVERKATLRQVALVRCTGGGRDREKYRYEGAADCLSASQVPGGGALSCAYGCLGLGSCAAACPFGAITVAEGAARVDEERCKGCLKCIPACPRHLITLIPYGADVSVLCMNRDRGAQARMVCADGCIACGLCEKGCPCDAIHVEGLCARIDYDKCISCGACVDACPRHLIRKS